MNRSVCDGLVVIEMGAGSIAASLAGMIFADNGARVLKIEPPDGDRLRRQHPSGFLVWNRGKESVVADLRTDEGRVLVRDLVARADVVLEGFGAGVADAWGIGYDAMREANPGLVYCSVKGFGSTGPYAKLPAYEAIVSAKAGVFNMGAFGFRDGPIFYSAPLASVGAGHMACAGVLAALVARVRTGRGQRVEATMLQGLNPQDYFGTMMYQHAVASAKRGQVASTDPMKVIAASRYSFFVPTEDGRWVIFTQMLPHQAQALSRACGLEATFDEPRFAKQPQFASPEDAQAWEDLVWEAMSKQPYSYWEKLFLADNNIAFELARFSEEGLDHEQIRHNGEAITVQHPTLGAIDQVGPVANFRGTPSRIERSAPELGVHGDEPAVATAPVAGSGSGSGGKVPLHPLGDITIVELGYFYAMPYGLTMAAGLGARVIKIEGRTGDPMRVSFGAAEIGGAKTMEGKESLAIDLSTEDGRAVVRKLASEADLFVNGFRPGALERMGLGYDDIKATNPRVVYIHAGGYGYDGPRAKRPMYAQVAQAVAGSVGRFAGRWLDPELTKSFSWFEAQVVSLPRVRGPVDGDANAALAVLTSTMLAVYDQAVTGEGQFVSTTMIGGNAIAYADDFIRYEGKPTLPIPDEESFGLNARYRLYRAASGWVFLAATTSGEWRACAEGVGRVDLLDDRFAGDDDALAAELTAVFAGRDAQAWEDLLVPLGVPCVRATEASRAEVTSTDPVLFETGLVVEVEHPLFGPIRRSAPVVTFSDAPGRAAPGSLLGQHTEAILAGLGYSDADITALKEKQVVFGRTELTT